MFLYFPILKVLKSKLVDFSKKIILGNDIKTIKKAHYEFKFVQK